MERWNAERKILAPEEDNPMKPDKICSANAGKVKISIGMTEDEEFFIIEGDAEALEFVGKLFIAQAKFEKDCSFFVGPRSAGNAFFTPQSTHGLYIHRLPCLEKPGVELVKKRKKPLPKDKSATRKQSMTS